MYCIQYSQFHSHSVRKLGPENIVDFQGLVNFPICWFYVHSALLSMTTLSSIASVFLNIGWYAPGVLVAMPSLKKLVLLPHCPRDHHKKISNERERSSWRINITRKTIGWKGREKLMHSMELRESSKMVKLSGGGGRIGKRASRIPVILTDDADEMRKWGSLRWLLSYWRGPLLPPPH